MTQVSTVAGATILLTGPTPESIQTAVRAIRRQGFGPAATFVWSGVGMHRPAEFNKGHVPAFMTGAPAQDYLVVYPFVKKRPWYFLSFEERADAMREHAPELSFVRRLDNPPVFADVDPERALKVLVYVLPRP